MSVRLKFSVFEMTGSGGVQDPPIRHNGPPVRKTNVSSGGGGNYPSTVAACEATLVRLCSSHFKLILRKL